MVPGVFRTEIRAKAPTISLHPAYSAVESVKQARSFVDTAWDPSRLMRVGDVDKAVERIYEVSALERPPMRLFLGKDCLEHVRAQLKRLTADLDGSEKWSEGLLEDE